MIRRTLLVVLLLAPGAFPVRAELLTLEGALELALAQSRLVESSEIEVDKAADGVAEKRSERLPQLNLQAESRYNFRNQSFEFEQGVFGNYPLIGPVPGQNVEITSQTGVTSVLSFTVVQRLTGLQRTNLEVERHETLEQMADERLRGSRQEIVKQVTDLYVEILQLDSDLEATREALVFYRELSALVDRYVEQQVALEYEALEVRARLARKEQDEARQTNKLQTKKERMNATLGRDVSVPFEVMWLPTVEPSEIDPRQAQRDALEQRPDVREARLQVRSLELARRATKSRYVPGIDLRADLARLYGVELIPDTVGRVGVVLRWDLYDWGRKRHEMSKQSGSIAQAGLDLNQTEANAVVDVNSSIRDLEDSFAQVDVALLARDAAREKLRVRTNQYRQQTILLDDLLEAETALEDANNAYNRAVLDVWKAQAALERAMGME